MMEVNMAGKFVLKKASNSQYRFNLKAENGEIILTSETYFQKLGALNGINSVKNNSSNDSRYERKISTNNQHYFVLKAMNNEIIGVSETYSTTQAMEAGIKSVKSNAPLATLEDLTQ
jgi:uncharacterized protein YegP (UPF0339 family)